MLTGHNTSNCCIHRWEMVESGEFFILMQLVHEELAETQFNAILWIDLYRIPDS